MKLILSIFSMHILTKNHILAKSNINFLVDNRTVLLMHMPTRFGQNAALFRCGV